MTDGLAAYLRKHGKKLTEREFWRLAEEYYRST